MRFAATSRDDRTNDDDDEEGEGGRRDKTKTLTGQFNNRTLRFDLIVFSTSLSEISLLSKHSLLDLCLVSSDINYGMYLHLLALVCICIYGGHIL